MYRDIPLPSWQVVYPDKLLQFRPLDLLRLDLFGVAGATAALAQAKYNSIVLQVKHQQHCGPTFQAIDMSITTELA